LRHADERRTVAVEGPLLGRGGRGDGAQQLLVPGGPEAHGLREGGRRAEPGDAVQRFGAGAEGRHFEPGDLRRVLVQHRHPLVRRQPGQQIVDALAQRPGGITERELVHGQLDGHGGGTHSGNPLQSAAVGGRRKRGEAAERSGSTTRRGPDNSAASVVVVETLRS